MFQKFISVLLVGFFLQNCAAFEMVSTSANTISASSTSLNSISTALNSVSSISGSFTSISGSSAKKAESMLLFKQDVRSLAFFYARNEGGVAFSRDMQTIANKHGILDWRDNQFSFTGIGEGLKKAGINSSDFQSLLSGYQGAEFSSWIREGYTNY